MRIDERNAGQRIDNFLMVALKGVPRSRIYRGLRDGEVRVNKGRVRQSYRLQTGDLVRLPPLSGVREQRLPENATGTGARLGSRLLERVVFEDADLLVVDKPAGMAVHGGSGLDFGLIEALRAVGPDGRMLELIHRLDRETSGCLLIAKKRSALISLHAQLRQGAVRKTYLALVKGRWRKLQNVDEPLLKNVLSSGERIVRVAPNGKPSVTEIRPLAASGVASLVRARPSTGRTHQIRVHALCRGHPIACDARYGDREFNRLARDHGLRRLYLHAARLDFVHPRSGRPVSVSAPLPDELESVAASFGLRLPGDGYDT